MEAGDDFDVIVLGAGAGGMSAACVAARAGLATLLLEKSALAGGTTAVSGGMLWIPGNRTLDSSKRAEDLVAARAYLEAILPESRDDALIHTYLSRGAEAIDYLETHTSVALRPVAFYPDYYPERPGATLAGRVLEPQPFDARELGKHFTLLRPPLPEFTLFNGMMVDRADIPHFRKVFRSLPSTARVARVVSRYLWDRVSFDRGAHLVLGNALAAQLLKSVIEAGVTLKTGVASIALKQAGNRVTGVVVEGTRELRARRAVIIATGGFSHSSQLRAQYFPSKTGAMGSAVCESNSGDGLRLGLEAGGVLPEDHANAAFWVPISRLVRSNGTAAVYPHTVTDRGKPGVIAVNPQGRRFVNEAVSYHEFVQAMLRADAVPAWLICDRDCLWTYGFGAIRPFTRSLRHYVETRYLTQADSVAELARALDLDPAVLRDTIERYNADARAGIDREFGKGSNAYHRYVGDAAHRPNPCMAPIERAPYFALALYPGDLGTSVGLRTDEHARVLDRRGEPIPGLYACGNDMDSIMKGAYPGPGITLGPALTFGYLAAMHIARSS